MTPELLKMSDVLWATAWSKQDKDESEKNNLNDFEYYYIICKRESSLRFKRNITLLNITFCKTCRGL